MSDAQEIIAMLHAEVERHAQEEKDILRELAEVFGRDSAPDWLKWAEKVIAYFDHPDLDGDGIEILDGFRAALAKARGES